MKGVYDPGFVLLSLLVAALASYTALSLAGRISAAQNTARQIWLAGGAISMGLGVWSMHFVGMLAFSCPSPWGTTWASPRFRWSSPSSPRTWP